MKRKKNKLFKLRLYMGWMFLIIALILGSVYTFRVVPLTNTLLIILMCTFILSNNFFIMYKLDELEFKLP